MTRLHLNAAIFLGVLAASLGATAQSSTTLRVSARLVEVPATVLDSLGHYVDGLGSADFQVLENGKPQKIKYFANNADALSCAILLDTTGSMDKALPRLKNSVVRFIDQLGPDDSVAVYSFAQTLEEQQALTKDKAAAKRAVLRLRAGGRTAFFDALAEVTRDLARQNGKKAVVVFTDGDDNASVLTSQATIGRATKDGVPLYSIAEGEATQSSRLKKVLIDLSKATGGEEYEVKDIKDVEDIFLKISNALKHIYLISYTPPLEPENGEWRQIELSVGSEKKYRVRAKEGYNPK